MSNNEIICLYLDYVNNWLTTERWQEHHGLTKLEANYILKKGKQLTR